MIIGLLHLTNYFYCIAKERKDMGEQRGGVRALEGWVRWEIEFWIFSSLDKSNDLK